MQEAKYVNKNCRQAIILYGRGFPKSYLLISSWKLAQLFYVASPSKIEFCNFCTNLTVQQHGQSAALADHRQLVLSLCLADLGGSRRTTQPASLKTGSTQTAFQRRNAAAKLPDKPTSIVLNHQHDGPHVDAEMKR